MGDFTILNEAVIKGDVQTAVTETQKALDARQQVRGIIDSGLIAALTNAAATGASMLLLSKDYWQTANKLVEFIEHVELSSRLDFNKYFIEHMDFPRENVW